MTFIYEECKKKEIQVKLYFVQLIEWNFAIYENQSWNAANISICGKPFLLYHPSSMDFFPSINIVNQKVENPISTFPVLIR